MHVFFHGFWNGFIGNEDNIKSSILIEMLSHVLNQEVHLGNKKTSDILVESVFSQSTCLFDKKWKYTFFFTGESFQNLGRFQHLRLGHYDCLLTGTPNDVARKNVNFPLFLYYLYSRNLVSRLVFPKTTPSIFVPTKNVCAVISNGSSSRRNEILDKINERIAIEYAGSFRNNVPKIQNNDYASTQLIELYSHYKFVVCFENTVEGTYITEKIVNGFLSGSIPLYFGTDKVFDYFNKDRFLYVNEASLEEAVQRMEEIMQNNDLYLQVVNQPVFKDNHLVLTLDQIEEKMKEVLFLEKEKEKEKDT